MKRIVSIIGILLMLVTGMGINGTTAEAKKKTDWPQGPAKSEIAAESACLMDLSTGQVLYSKNMHKEQYPASITKIMTVLLALENCSLGETVTFSTDAIYGIEPDSAHIACEVGEELSIEQCLYGMMLPSANEVCLGVAEHIAGSKDKFADLMNQKAKELGCKNTHFSNPNGLHEDSHYTSAYDMALISRAAWQYEMFRKVTGTKYYTMAKTNKKKEERYLLNNHQMLYGWKYPQYEYEYCVGGKTGFTDRSLWTLVTFTEQDGMSLVSVVMRDYGPTYPANEYTDSTSLAEFAFNNFTLYDISQEGSQGESGSLDNDFLFTRYTPIFSVENAPVYIGDGGSVLLPKGVDLNQAEKSVHYGKSSSHEGKEGEDTENGENVIGTVDYIYDDRTVGHTDVIYREPEGPKLETAQAVSEVTNKKIEEVVKKQDIKPFLIIGVAVILVLVVLAGCLVLKSRRKSEFSFYKGRHRRR